MGSSRHPDVFVCGVGVVSSVGQGRDDFVEGLLAGEARFGVLRRPGRQRPDVDTESGDAGGLFIGAELGELPVPVVSGLERSRLRTVSLSTRAALACASEAWAEAGLAALNPTRVGLIVGGSNVQQRELALTHDAYRQRLDFLRPTYALSFSDTDICGLCTEVLGIRGPSFTLGGASASGQVAFVQACRAVQSGSVDACIAVGALMDLSYWECQGFRAIGAMGSTRFATRPQEAARPFDRDRDGFIFGESSAALVVARAETVERCRATASARVAGVSWCCDANRNPNPSFDGEVAAIREALDRAGVRARDIDYVNPHGSGSPIGDETEARALMACDLGHARINSTKSIVGHGLSAAGATELAATVLQMQAGRLHPCRNLLDPIEPDLGWVRGSSVEHRVRSALSLSMGFGGVNSAVCLCAP